MIQADEQNRNATAVGAYQMEVETAALVSTIAPSSLLRNSKRFFSTFSITVVYFKKGDFSPLISNAHFTPIARRYPH